MYERELCETYKRCTLLLTMRGSAKAIIPEVVDTTVNFNVLFSCNGHDAISSYVCHDMNRKTAQIHAKNVLTLYRTCISPTGELPNILPDYCSKCGRLYFSNNSRFNRLFHTCTNCRIDECNKTIESQYSETCYVYMIYCKEDNTVKIGNSINPQKRLAQLQTGNNKTLTLIGLIRGDQTLEKNIHNLFSSYRIKGEWFSHCEEIDSFFSKYKV